MSRVPRIRFKGFEEDWEQRKLGEVFEEYSEKNHSELPPLTIIQGGGTIRRDESDRALQYDRSSLSNYKMVNKGDFIVHLRSFEGGLEKANSKGIISPAYHTFNGKNTDTTFYYTYFRSEKFIESDLKPYVYGIRDGRSIDIEGMKSINIPYTIFDEQNRIGEFIDSINHLITLHQRKLEKLKIIKKSMLENLFPQNGEKTPKIRFSGFTKDWEQRKLGEIVDVCNGRDYKHLLEGDIPVYGTGGYMISVNKALSYDRDAIGIGRKGTIDKPYILNAPFWTVDTLFYVIPKDKIALIFAFGIFQNIDWEKKDESTGVPSLSKAAINEIDVLVPKYEEQKVLGLFFNAIDHLITLHQSKLEKLQKIKKSMLESMFV